jgi:hypothetical protein
MDKVISHLLSVKLKIYHQLLRIFRMAVFFCEEEEEESKQISTAWAF